MVLASGRTVRAKTAYRDDDTHIADGSVGQHGECVGTLSRTAIGRAQFTLSRPADHKNHGRRNCGLHCAPHHGGILYHYDIGANLDTHAKFWCFDFMLHLSSNRSIICSFKHGNQTPLTSYLLFPSPNRPLSVVGDTERMVTFLSTLLLLLCNSRSCSLYSMCNSPLWLLSLCNMPPPLPSTRPINKFL